MTRLASRVKDGEAKKVPLLGPRKLPIKIPPGQEGKVQVERWCSVPLTPSRVAHRWHADAQPGPG